MPFTEVNLLTLKEAFKNEECDGDEKGGGGKMRSRRRCQRTTPRATSHSLAINVLRPDKIDVDITVVQDVASQVSHEKVPELPKEAWKMNKDKLFYVKLLGRD